MRRAILVLMLTVPTAALAQLQPSLLQLGWCMNAGSWIPLATSSANASAALQPSTNVGLYGTNSGNSVPLACDSSGNLIVSGGTTGTGTANYYALWTGTTTLGIGHIDDGVTNAGAITASEGVYAAFFTTLSGLSSLNSGGFQIQSQSPITTTVTLLSSANNRNAVFQIGNPTNTAQWKWFEASTSFNLNFFDVNGASRNFYTPAGVTQINAAGTSPIYFNGNQDGGGLGSTGGAAFQSGGASPTTVATIDGAGNGTFLTLNTNTKCAAVGTSASPSVVSCSAAAAGHFSCATNASAATCTINTTAATVNSTILVDSVGATSIGTLLGVTCNTAPSAEPTIKLTAQSAGSFSINPGTFITNPACFEYAIINSN